LTSGQVDELLVRKIEKRKWEFNKQLSYS